MLEETDGGSSSPLLGTTHCLPLLTCSLWDVSRDGCPQALGSWAAGQAQAGGLLCTEKWVLSKGCNVGRLRKKGK